MKVLVTSRSYGKYTPEYVKRLESVAEVEFAEDPPLGEDRLIKILGDFDAIIAGMDELTGKVLSKGRRLKLVARHGVGLDNVDLSAATENGIIVTYTPGANTNAVAEHTMGLILALAKNIKGLDEFVRKGGWRPGKPNMELRAKTLGIIGFGRVGRRVAELARIFGMRILAYDPYIDRSIFRRFGVEPKPLDELLSESDIVTLHATLTKESIHMIGGRELKLMKRTAYIINTARGKLIDEKALIEALKKGEIAGAALDVFEDEPPSKENELLKLNNVLLTPHSAAYTIEAVKEMDKMVTEDVLLALRGEVPRNVANPEVLDRDNLRIKRFI